MKTTHTLIMGLFGLSSLVGNAQNNQQNNLGTSGGLNAGTTTSGLGGNAFYGYKAGNANTNSGIYNTFIGDFSGQYNINGSGNTFIGNNAGGYNPPGNENIALGNFAGQTNGNSNIFIGNKSGAEDSDTGSGNIFIGHNAGFANGGPGNRLIIDNGLFPVETVTPLIWGDFSTDQLKFHGKVGIGGGGASDVPFGNFPTTAGSVGVSKYNLFVKGGILTEEIRVSLNSTWADYVFAKNYQLPTLPEVEQFIAEKGHLPNVPSAAEVAQNGFELGEMAKIQQEKIEELTLYIIEQNKINEKQSHKIEELTRYNNEQGKINEKLAQEMEELKALVANLVQKNK